MTYEQISAVDNHIFAIVARLKRQIKQADIDSIYA